MSITNRPPNDSDRVSPLPGWVRPSGTSVRPLARSVADDTNLIAERKNEHLRVALEDQVEVAQPLGWNAIRLVPRALPEMARDDVDPSVTILGKRLAFPLIVGSMTGGTDEARLLNMRLGRAAQRAGIGMGLGSQRVMLREPELAKTFAVRDQAPDLPLLIANIGAVQLNYGVDVAGLERVCDLVAADALVLHLNAAQEAVQPEGDTNFGGLAAAMRRVATQVSRPVGIKEVGQGFSRADIALLMGSAPGPGGPTVTDSPSPFAFIESAGAGGTSWTLIEGKRKAAARTMGELFADWGVPTVTSLLNCVSSGLPTIASGGLRTGLDGARAIACGAAVCAMALPLLKAAADSEDAAYDAMMAFREALVTAMFLTGAETLADLRNVPRHIDPRALPAAWEGASPEGVHVP